MEIKLNNYKIANNLPFTLIAGPCQIENLEHSLKIAGELKRICEKLSINLIFKGSFDKANRTSMSGKRGLGIEKTTEIFREVKKQFNLPITTDVHSYEQCDMVADVVDILQIPAFLCRQTDLLEAAAKTGKIVNVKKAQFLAPWDMKNVYEKLKHFGAKDIMLTERGTCFGYNRLVVDMRGLKIMKEQNEDAPVFFDATHSVQEPGGQGGSSGGDREMAPVLARAALSSTCIAGIFAEIHDDPDNAPSDGKNMIRLDKAEEILSQFKQIDDLIKTMNV